MPDSPEGYQPPPPPEDDDIRNQNIRQKEYDRATSSNTPFNVEEYLKGDPQGPVELDAEGEIKLPSPQESTKKP